MATRTLIWTGFEPFLEYAYNPSWDVARAAAEASAGQAHRLRVDFEAARQVGELWRMSDGPARIVHLGLAAARTRVELERFAHNARGGRDDRSDATSEDRERLVGEGPLALETSLRVGRLVDAYHALAADELPRARISRDAGTYVCNATYYHSLWAHRLAPQVEVLFIHVPSMEPEQARELGRVLASVLAPG